MSQLRLSVSPHIKSKRNTQSIMLDVIIALMPTLAAASYLFGLRSLLLTAVSVVTCVGAELIYQKAMKKPVTISDLSAVVTGILIAFNVPYGLPIWQLMVADIAAIIVAKQLFGGIGCNFMNPALVGRIVLMFSFAANMTTYTYPANGVDVLSSATPLVVMNQLQLSDLPTLLFGNYGGVIGETCAITLLIGGVYLCVRKVIKPIIPLVGFASLTIFTWAFGGDMPLLAIFSGGAMLGYIFMATDYVTSPYTNKGKVIYAIFIGFINALIRVFGNYAEGMTFAILLGNILVPYINELSEKKVLGAIYPSKKKKEAK